MSIREKTYVEAGRAVGVSTPSKIVRHILPNGMAPIIVQATLRGCVRSLGYVLEWRHETQSIPQ